MMPFVSITPLQDDQWTPNDGCLLQRGFIWAGNDSPSSILTHFFYLSPRPPLIAGYNPSYI